MKNVTIIKANGLLSQNSSMIPVFQQGCAGIENRVSLKGTLFQIAQEL